MELVSGREFARRVNASEGGVRKWIKAGKIPANCLAPDPVTGKEFIIYELAFNEVRKFRPDVAVISEQKKPDPEPAGEVPGPKEPKPEKKPLTPEPAKRVKVSRRDIEPDDGGMTFGDAERREKIAKAQLAELQLEEKLGNLIPAADVRKALFEFGVTIRNNIMSVPDRVIDNIVASDDRAAAHSILVIELNKSLSALAEIDSMSLSSKEKQI